MKSQITRTASILTETSHITVGEVNEFVCSYKEVTATRKSHDKLYKEFLEHGSLNDDQFALFLTAMEDLEAYLAVYPPTNNTLAEDPLLTFLKAAKLDNYWDRLVEG